MTDADRIRQFLAKRWAKGKPARSRLKITKSTPLFGPVFDSFGMLELVAFLEETFGIRLLKRDIGVRRLGTLGRIEALVKSKKRAKKA